MPLYTLDRFSASKVYFNYTIWSSTKTTETTDKGRIN